MCGTNCNCGCSCDCSCGCNDWRRFRTSEEKRSRLKEYRKELNKELEAVNERLDELQ
ncbi:MAG: DUF5320 domain-containing protein [Candidatus Aenigmatarchaeota archaeon]